jgi:dGTPase
LLDIKNLSIIIVKNLNNYFPGFDNMGNEIEATTKSNGRCPIIENYDEKDENNEYIGQKIHDFDIDDEINDLECWEIDREKIVNSTPFRRLQGKTQIYVSTFGDHYSDRMTHTILVTEIARKISKRLKLNGIIEESLTEPLIEAISLGHDLGHTPFGHEGEKTLNDLMKNCDNGGFAHNIQGARVAIYIEYDKIWSNKNVGMNLTWEVISGIMSHTNKSYEKYNSNVEFKSNKKLIETSEGKVVFYADEIAQRVFDIDDALRTKIIKKDDIRDIWKNIFSVELPNSFKQRLIEEYIKDIIENNLLGRNFETIYKNPYQNIKKLDNELNELIECKIHCCDIVRIMNKRGRHIIETLFNRYLENWEELDKKVNNEKEMNIKYCEKDYLLPWKIRENKDCFDLSRERVVANYIASMTDSFAEMEYFRLFK